MVQLQCGNASVPVFALSDGNKIPAIGLGTYQVAGDDVKNAVKNAIDCGYRHIDTAFLYKNEQEVGAAIREKIDEGVVSRSDMFVTTKVSKFFHRAIFVTQCHSSTLAMVKLS